MKATIRLASGDMYTIANMPDGDALDLAEAFRDDVDGTLTFDMDGATVIVDRRHLAAVELEQGGAK